MRRALLPVLLACLPLAGCAPTTVDSLVKDQGARQMPGPEVLQLVKGNTLELHSFNENAHLFFEPSGKVFAKNATSSDKDSKLTKLAAVDGGMAGLLLALGIGALWRRRRD